MQGSTHPRCSGTCGRDGKGRKLEGSLVMPALLGIAMQMQSHSDSAASISVAAALQHMSPLHRRDASLSFYDRYHSALLPASDRLKLNRHQQRRSERTSARILFYSLPYHIH